MVVWDDPDGVRRILESPDIKEFDLIAVFDGKFTLYEGNQEYRSDSIYKEVEKFDKTAIYYEMLHDMTEAEQRNHSMQVLRTMGIDYNIIIDSDETIKYDRNYFLDIEEPLYRESEYACFSVILNHFGVLTRRPRIIKMNTEPYYMQFPLKRSHSSIFSGVTGKEITTQITQWDYDSKSISLSHDKTLRSDYRKDNCTRYRKTPNH